MVLMRRFHKRNVSGYVEANAEILFTGSGEVGRWTRQLSLRIRAATERAAPSNKRPRWGHYGKPLKSTFTATTSYQPGRMRVYAGIGSTAGHALYVDQGTGVHGGTGPYPAKILPPWTWGGTSLYESTWKASPTSKPAGPVMIKGQRGQFFFEKGLAAGMASMRMRSYQVPSDPRMAAAIRTMPAAVSNFVSVGGGGGAFQASLEQWREWRDAAHRNNRVLGEGFDIAERDRRWARKSERAEQSRLRKRMNSESNRRRRAAESKVRSQKRRDRLKAEKEAKGLHNAQATKKAAQAAQAKDLRAERARFLAAMIKKYGASNVETASLELRGGYYYLTVRKQDDRGKSYFDEVRGKSKILSA